jgi:hypothetical protein
MGDFGMKCPKCHFDNPSGTRFCGNCAAPLLAASENSPTEIIQTPVRELTGGSTFARRYQIIEDLSKGGMGRAYKVFDTEVREKMALKLLHPESAGPAAQLARWQQHQGGGKRSRVDTLTPGI